MFKYNFIEGLTQTSTLEEDDPEGFKLFLNWLYRDCIELPADADKASPIPAFIHLFAFAEKFVISDLADNTIDTLIKILLQKSWLPSPAEMVLGYKLTPETSKLRLFLSRLFVFMTLRHEEQIEANDWNNASLATAVQQCGDLLMDSLALMRGKSGLVQKDPRKVSPCDYHQHKAAEACPHAPVTPAASSSSPSASPAFQKKRKRT
jgi:hypothetical protein